MNIYLLSQDDVGGWDTYDNCVVAAESEDAARRVHPDGRRQYFENEKLWGCTRPDGRVSLDRGWDTWTPKLDKIKVELIGTAVPGTEAGVICASFNAG